MVNFSEIIGKRMKNQRERVEEDRYIRWRFPEVKSTEL